MQSNIMNFQNPDTESLIVWIPIYYKPHLIPQKRGGRDILDKEHYWLLNLETAYNYQLLAYHTTTALWFWFYITIIWNFRAENSDIPLSRANRHQYFPWPVSIWVPTFLFFLFGTELVAQILFPLHCILLTLGIFKTLQWQFCNR
jgi:hypothetical protein